MLLRYIWAPGMALSHQSSLSNKPCQKLGLLVMSFQIYFWEWIDKSHKENIKIYQQLWLYL